MRHRLLVGDPLQLSTGPVWVDVEAFEAAVQRATTAHDPACYHHAVKLYQGDLLPDDLYAEWCVDRRVALREVYIDLLFRIATFHEARGEWDTARNLFQRLVAVDVAHEGGHQGLMRFYARADQPHRALRQFDHLVAALRREFDTTPSATSHRLRADIQASRVGHNAQPTDETQRHRRSAC